MPELVEVENDGPDEIHKLETSKFVAWELRLVDADGVVRIITLDGATKLTLTAEKPKPIQKQIAQTLDGAKNAISDAFSSVSSFFSRSKK